MRFGAAISDRVQIASTAELSGLTAWTTVQLVRPTTLIGGIELIAKGAFVGGTRRIEVRLSGTGGNLGTFIDGATDLNYATTSTPLATLNQWYWVATVADLSLGAGQRVKYYVASLTGPWVLQAVSVTAEGVAPWASDAGIALNIGNASSNNLAFNGDIAFTALSGAALSLNEFEAIRRQRTGAFRGALGAWDVGADGQLVVLDITGRGNHGAIVGAVLSQGDPIGASQHDPPLARWKRALFASSGTGTLTATLDAATLSATGALPITGAATATLTAATASATGTLAIAGALTATLGTATLAATGALALAGSLTATLANATVAGVGTLPIVGTATATLADATLSGTGTIGSFATLAVTLDAATLTATGTLPIVGAATVTLSAATLSGTGALPIVATLTATLATVTLSATGTGSDTGTSAAYMAASLFHVADTDEIYYTADTDPIYFTATEG